MSSWRVRRPVFGRRHRQRLQRSGTDRRAAQQEIRVEGGFPRGHRPHRGWTRKTQYADDGRRAARHGDSRSGARYRHVVAAPMRSRAESHGGSARAESGRDVVCARRTPHPRYQRSPAGTAGRTAGRPDRRGGQLRNAGSRRAERSGAGYRDGLCDGGLLRHEQEDRTDQLLRLVGHARYVYQAFQRADGPRHRYGGAPHHRRGVCQGARHHRTEERADQPDGGPAAGEGRRSMPRISNAYSARRRRCRGRMTSRKKGVVVADDDAASGTASAPADARRPGPERRRKAMPEARRERKPPLREPRTPKKS